MADPATVRTVHTVDEDRIVRDRDLVARLTLAFDPEVAHDAYHDLADRAVDIVTDDVQIARVTVGPLDTDGAHVVYVPRVAAWLSPDDAVALGTLLIAGGLRAEEATA